MKQLPGRAHEIVCSIIGILAALTANMATAEDSATGNSPQATLPLTVLPHGPSRGDTAQRDTPSALAHGPAYALEDLREVFGNVSFRSGTRGQAASRRATGPVASDELFSVMLRARFGTWATYAPVALNRPKQFQDAFVHSRQPGATGRPLTYGDMVTRR